MDSCHPYLFFGVVGILDSPAAIWPLHDIDSEALAQDPISLAWVPSILEYGPKNDSLGCPQSKEGIPSFCFPYGVTLQLEAPAIADTKFHSFVMTKENGEKAYGACFSYLKKLENIDSKSIFKTVFTILTMVNLPTAEISKTGDDVEEPQSLYTWESIVLISPFPYVDSSKQVLTELYEISKNGDAELPLESYLYNILFECPDIPTGCDVNLFVGDKTIKLPGIGVLPAIDFDMRVIFDYFSIEGVLKLFSCMLSDEKVVVISEDIGRLTIVCEALIHLMFPFPWCHPYVPVLPHAMLQFLEAPTPFLMGVRIDQFQEAFTTNNLTGLVVANCDSHDIVCDDDIESLPNLKDLEIKISSMLRNTALTAEEFSSRIQKVFVNYFGKLMRSYEDYLFLPSDNNFTMFNVTGDTYLFDSVAFVSALPAAYRTFFSALVESQTFSSFLDMKYESSTVEKVAHVEYFDLIVANTPEPVPNKQTLDLPRPGMKGNISGASVGPLAFSEIKLDNFPLSREDVERKTLTIPVIKTKSRASFSSDRLGSFHRSSRRVSKSSAVVQRTTSSLPASASIQKRMSMSSLALTSLAPEPTFNPQSVFILELFDNVTSIVNKLSVSNSDWVKICSDMQLMKHTNELQTKKKLAATADDNQSQLKLSRKTSLGTQAIMGLMKHHEGASSSIQNSDYLDEALKKKEKKEKKWKKRISKSKKPKTQPSAAVKEENKTSAIMFNDVITVREEDDEAELELVSASSDTLDMSKSSMVHSASEDQDPVSRMEEITKQLNSKIDTEINKLCTALEAVFSHGSDRGKKAFGMFIFQSDLSKSESATKDRKRIKRLFNVKTPIGMGRAFVRFCLGKGNLNNHLGVVLTDTDLIESHYKPFAILSQAEHIERLKNILLPLNHVVINTTAVNESSSKDYNLTFYTSDVFNGGTSAGLKLILIGLLNRTMQMQLTRGTDAFVRGGSDSYTIAGNKLGEIIGIALENDGTGLSPAWHLDHVTVEDTSTGKIHVLTSRNWIGVKGEKDTVYLSVDSDINDSECELEIWLMSESHKKINPPKPSGEQPTSSMESINSDSDVGSPLSRSPAGSPVPRKSMSVYNTNAPNGPKKKPPVKRSSLSQRFSGLFSSASEPTVPTEPLAPVAPTPPPPPPRERETVNFQECLEMFDHCVEAAVVYVQEAWTSHEDHAQFLSNYKRIFKQQMYQYIVGFFSAGFKGRRKFFADLSIWDFILKNDPNIGGGHLTTTETAFKKTFELIERCLPNTKPMVKFEIFIYIGLSKNMLHAWVTQMRNFPTLSQYYDAKSVFLQPSLWAQFEKSLAKLHSNLRINIPAQLVSDYL